MPVAPPGPRRPSTNNVPSLFAHSGIKTPSAASSFDAQTLLDSSIEQPPTDSSHTLAESRLLSQVDLETVKFDVAIPSSSFLPLSYLK
jgi:hypothetical protein